MTLESYRNFVTIVECGSILAAESIADRSAIFEQSAKKYRSLLWGEAANPKPAQTGTDRCRASLLSACQRDLSGRGETSQRDTQQKDSFFRTAKAVNPCGKLRLFSAPSLR